MWWQKLDICSLEEKHRFLSGRILTLNADFGMVQTCGKNCFFYSSTPGVISQDGGWNIHHYVMILVIWVFPKIMVPPNHPFVHRVFHYFHHPFWGPTPIFGNTHIVMVFLLGKKNGYELPASEGPKRQLPAFSGDGNFRKIHPM